MKIYTMEECMQWMGFHKYYWDAVELQYYFRPKNKQDQDYFMRRAMHSNDKTFNHNAALITSRVWEVVAKCPTIEPVIDKLQIFMMPKCDLKGANAMASEQYVCYFGKPTQIPTFMTDYITAHELGHSFMFHFFDKYKDKDLMRQYLKLRNAPRGMCEIHKGWDNKTKESIYEQEEDFLFMSGKREQSEPQWDEHPYEWFAEDFRWFFGTDKQEFWGLPIPRPTAEIRDFILSLKENSQDNKDSNTSPAED